LHAPESQAVCVRGADNRSAAIHCSERGAAGLSDTRLKEAFGGRTIWVKGEHEVMAHLKLGILAWPLTIRCDCSRDPLRSLAEHMLSRSAGFAPRAENCAFR